MNDKSEMAEDLDVSPCMECGEPVETVPEGLALCKACAEKENDGT